MVFGGWLDYEKTGSVDGPVLCMGFDGITVGVRYVDDIICECIAFICNVSAISK